MTWTLDDLLPHRAPMVFLDAVESFDSAARALTATISITPEHVLYSPSLGGVPNWAAIEFMAQAAAALADAGLAPSGIGYLNLHGTGTQANDAMEMKAVRRVFGENFTAYESTKPFTGHCLGAAGAVEAAICWLKLQAGDVVGAALSNSFAFGGSNASVLLAREDA